jgi:V/A-type H+-transporting ATPase subunit I
MIVPMKKAIIILETKDAESAIRCVRQLGVLHVEHQEPLESREISALQEKVSLADLSFDVLHSVTLPQKNLPQQKKISGDWMALVNRLVELAKRREELETSTELLPVQIREWERWGEVDPDQIRYLGQHGIYLKLFRVPIKEVDNFPDDVIIRTIFTSTGIAHCVAISRRSIDSAFEEVLPPTESLSSLKSRLAENTKTMNMIKDEILEYACFYDELVAKKNTLEKEIRFQQVLQGMGKEGVISYVSGYIPSNWEDRLVAEAKKRRWGILVTDPSAEDNVPTLLQNPAWVNLIKPVLGLLGLTPGYHELDVSMVFLIFFSIFFGILIGDAGYGLVYILLTLLLTLWLYRTMRMTTDMKTTVSLFLLLGFSAIIWGILTGTFFGQGWLQPLVPRLNDVASMETFCFFLGATHLSLAHSWRAIVKYPSLTAIADIGYICILWTAFFLARTLILGDPFPSFGLWLVGTGVVLVIVFTSPQARVLRGIGEGLGTMALSFMNNITDVISYVRLFAVGLATLAIAETTNTLASGFGSGVVALGAGFAILIIGHGLNIILGIISVLVHGVRLNVLEFSGHANVTWSGSPFEPLKE